MVDQTHGTVLNQSQIRCGKHSIEKATILFLSGLYSRSVQLPIPLHFSIAVSKTYLFKLRILVFPLFQIWVTYWLNRLKKKLSNHLLCSLAVPTITATFTVDL